jgi:hypothetical protein
LADGNAMGMLLVMPVTQTVPVMMPVPGMAR